MGCLLQEPGGPSWRDIHLKSKLRIGTEVVVTFPPERVVAAIAPLSEHAPSIVPDSEQEPGPKEEPLQAPAAVPCWHLSPPALRQSRNCVPSRCPYGRPGRIADTHDRNPLRQNLHSRCAYGPVSRLRPYSRRNRALDEHDCLRTCTSDARIARASCYLHFRQDVLGNGMML